MQKNYSIIILFSTIPFSYMNNNGLFFLLLEPIPLKSTILVNLVFFIDSLIEDTKTNTEMILYHLYIHQNLFQQL